MNSDGDFETDELSRGKREIGQRGGAAFQHFKRPQEPHEGTRGRTERRSLESR